MTSSFPVLVVGDDPTELLFTEKKIVAFDTETTGLEFTSELLGFSLAWKASGVIRSCYCHVPQGQMSMDEITDVLGQMDGAWLMEAVHKQHVVVTHNQSFDYRMALRSAKLDPPMLSHDTIHLAGLSSYNSSYKLIHLLGKHVTPFEVPSWYKESKEDRGGISKWPLGKTARYARFDAASTLRLLDGLRLRFDVAMQLVPRLNLQTYNRDRAFARVVMQMIQRGLPVDQDWCVQRLRQFKQRTLEIEKELTGQGLRFIGSNDNVATFLYRHLNVNEFGRGALPSTNVRTKKWPTGIPAVDEKTLLQFKEYPQVKLILEHRNLTHGISTWLEPYLRESALDGSAHALISPFGTISRRITASHPNVAAIPMEDRGDAFGSFKGMFKGEKGTTLRAYDLKQAEVRLAAMCARANSLAKMFNADRDPYVEMADITWHDPTRRQDAKRAVLSGIYEIGPTSYATKYDVDEGTAYRILNDFRRAVPEIKPASRMDANFAEANGYIPAWDGTPRWFGPDAIDPYYKAFNQRVQMGLARLVEYAMLDIEREFPGMLRLQVYDSVVLCVPDEQQEQVDKRVKEILADVVPDNLRRMTRPSIPMLVDAKKWQL